MKSTDLSKCFIKKEQDEYFAQRNYLISKCLEFDKLIDIIDYHIHLLNNINMLCGRFPLNFTSYKVNEHIEFTKSFSQTDISESFDAFFEFALKGLGTIEKYQNIDLFLLFDNLVATLYSIKSCANLLSLADCMMLIRKFKDDFLITLLMLRLNRGIEKSKATKIEIELWNNKIDLGFNWFNQKEKFNYAKIFKLLNEIELIGNFNQTFEIESRMKKMTSSLNNYAHTNGLKFINYLTSDVENLSIRLKSIHSYIDFICISFISILFLLKPEIMSSTDYVDSLEMGVAPIKDSQYWIVPFFQDFLDGKVEKFNIKMKEYLLTSTYMQLEK